VRQKGGLEALIEDAGVEKYEVQKNNQTLQNFGDSVQHLEK
jgi:hypothetical protein